jgi:hypothetical protein
MGDAVADVVLDDETDEQGSQQDTDGGKNEVQVIGFIAGERSRHEAFHPVDHAFEQKGGKRGQQTDHETQQQDEIGFFDVFFAPTDDAQVLFTLCHNLFLPGKPKVHKKSAQSKQRPIDHSPSAAA